MRPLAAVTSLGLVALAAACAPNGDGTTALVGATVIDGTGSAPLRNATMLLRGGRIEVVAPRNAVEVPPGANIVDVTDKVIVPGLINTHVHVGDSRGLETGHYSEENVLRQLRLYARYGVTTVNSLGGDGEAGIRVRDNQDIPTLDRARLHAAGTVVIGETPAEALALVDRNAALGVDYIKIRVDDFLGTREKMSPAIYGAVIERAHERGLRVAAHLFYLDDAKSLLRAGVDFLAHSVRDRKVDDDLVDLMRDREVCLTPTLTRDLSTFAYESIPSFFSDPFFLAEADPVVLEQLSDPARQQDVGENPSTQLNKRALKVATRNLATLSDAGVRLALGTDTGPPGRFQGYFAHLELEMMVDAGLSPMQVLVAATGDAARCLGLSDVGTLAEGKWADFLVLGADPPWST